MAGQIVNRGDNTWLVRIYVGRDGTGKRKYVNKTIHGTKKDAERYRTEQLRNRDLGLMIAPAAETVNAYLDRWLKDAAKSKVRRKTFEGYEQILRTHVRPRIGNLPLGKVKPLDVQSLYNAMTDSGLSPRTVQYTNMILKQAFKQAIRWRLLTFNPCDGVELPRQQRKEMQVLTPEQTRAFLKECKNHRYGVVVALAVTSGMRPSEYSALKWPDIDFDRGILSINRSLDRLPNGGWEFAENKTGRSRRTVKLHGIVIEGLWEWKHVREEMRRSAGERWQEHGLVFTTEVGTPIDRHNLARRTFRAILKAAGLPKIRLYDLRHTSATLALSAGVPVKVVSEQLGHASAAMTLDVYSHVLPHMQDEAVRRVEALLADPEPTPDGRHTIGTQVNSARELVFEEKGC